MKPHTALSLTVKMRRTNKSRRLFFAWWGERWRGKVIKSVSICVESGNELNAVKEKGRKINKEIKKSRLEGNHQCSKFHG